MTDIVERLRAASAYKHDREAVGRSAWFTEEIDAALLEGATEIETLRADRDQLLTYLPESHWDLFKQEHPDVARRLSWLL